MQRPSFIRRHRRLTAAALFVAFLCQAMIPAGFMPASDGTFSLQVCHSGMPEHVAPDAAGHSHGHVHVDCPFGALPGAGPLLQIALFRPLMSGAPQVAALQQQTPPFTRPERAHPARAPPSLALS
jgi:hypothetical protein